MKTTSFIYILIFSCFSWVYSQPVRIMPLGDSITWGTNHDSPEDSSGYREFLYQDLSAYGYDIDFVGSLTGDSPSDPDNEGHPGWEALRETTPAISLIDHLTEFLTANPPDIILLHIGTNDISAAFSNYDEGSDLAFEVHRILDTIYNFDPGITTIVAKIIDRGDLLNRHQRTINFNDTLELTIDSLPAGQREKVVLVDMYSALGEMWGNLGNPNFSDSIHPSIQGFEVMADTWFSALRGVLPVLADIKIFLQGPYSAGLMGNQINTLGYLPVSQPYYAAPWNYTGEERVTAEFYSAKETIVDWVLVELRDENDSTNVVASRAGFIQNNGTVVDTDGVSSVGFPGMPPGNYYIAVKHRNHLGVMSAAPVSLREFIPQVYDFRTGSNKFFGGSSGARDLGGGVWGMIAGDANGNGGISIDDRNLVWRVENGSLGYRSGDFNLNGGVNIDDRNLFWRINNGNLSQIP